MLTILPSSSTWAILLSSRAIYFCIPLKAIQYYINIPVIDTCSPNAYIVFDSLVMYRGKRWDEALVRPDLDYSEIFDEDVGVIPGQTFTVNV